MSGKGDRDRTTDREKYEENYSAIFGEDSETKYQRVFRPREPLYSDSKRYEARFRKVRNSGEKVRND